MRNYPIKCPSCEEPLVCKNCGKSYEPIGYDHFRGFSAFSTAVMPHHPDSFFWSDIDMVFCNRKTKTWHIVEFKADDKEPSWLQQQFFGFLSKIRGQGINIYWHIIKTYHEKEFYGDHEKMGDPSYARTISMHNVFKAAQINLRELIYILCELHGIEFPNLEEIIKEKKEHLRKCQKDENNDLEDEINYIKKVLGIIEKEDIDKEKNDWIFRKRKMRNYEKVSENVLSIIRDTIKNNPEDLDPNITRAKIISLFVLAKKCDFSGKMEKATGVWKYLSDFNYVLLLFKPTWMDLTEDSKHALVLHELMHVKSTEDKDENIHWQVRKHDIELFICVVRKFGFWSPQLKVLETLKGDEQE